MNKIHKFIRFRDEKESGEREEINLQHVVVFLLRVAYFKLYKADWHLDKAAFF